MIAIKAIRLAMHGRGLHNCMGYTRKPMPQHDKVNYVLENIYIIIYYVLFNERICLG